MWRRQDPHARLVLKTQLPDFHGPTAHDTPTRWQLPGVARSRRESRRPPPLATPLLDPLPPAIGRTLEPACPREGEPSITSRIITIIISYV